MKTLNYSQPFALIIVFTMMAAFTCYSQNTANPKGEKFINDTLIVDDSRQPAQRIYYTCPGHPKVRSKRAGNCPQCGMTMDKRKETVYYSCLKHSEVQHGEKGSCERCGAELKEEHQTDGK